LPILDKTKKSAEEYLRDAFERLKNNTPELLPKGTRVSQNNVAREAGSDPSALRKTRYPLLIIEIQDWINKKNIDKKLVSKRQKLLNKQRKNRDVKKINADLKKQRDKAVDRIIYANLRILELSEIVDDLRYKLETLQPSAKILNFSKEVN
jgi:hypothetical protein